MNDNVISTRPLLLRQLTWDMIPHEDVEEVMQSMNLLPGSEENMEMEHKDTHVRDFMITPSIPSIVNLSSMAIEVLAHYAKCKGDPPSWMVNDESFVEIQKFIHGVVIGVLTAMATTNVTQSPVIDLGDEGV
jgi:hypothetical protein